MCYYIKIKKEIDSQLISEIDYLNKHSKIPSINTNSDFIKVFNNYLMENWKPLFVRVFNEDSNKIVGILPLMYLKRFRKGVLPYKTIKFFASTFSDFSDIYSEKNKRKIVIKESLNWLFENFTWQELALDDLLPESNLIEPILDFAKKRSIRYTMSKGKYFYINLNRGWEDIRKDTSYKFVRKNINSSRNRLKKAGYSDFELDCNPNLSGEKILQLISPIHIERQSSLNRDSKLLSRNFQLSYEEIINYSIKKKEFRSFWLKLEDQYIAYILGFSINNIFYAWNTSFNKDYKEFYPGRMIFYLSLKKLHEFNYHEFNFMRGEGEYKQKWTKTYRDNYRFKVYNRNMYSDFHQLIDKVRGI